MRDVGGCVYYEECEFGNIGGALLVEWGCRRGALWITCLGFTCALRMAVPGERMYV